MEEKTFDELMKEKTFEEVAMENPTVFEGFLSAIKNTDMQNVLRCNHCGKSGYGAGVQLIAFETGGFAICAECQEVIDSAVKEKLKAQPSASETNHFSVYDVLPVDIVR